MFSNLDDAYMTATDLLKTQKNCVYDNILEDESVFGKTFPKNMFSAQGDMQSYQDLENVYKLNNNISVPSGTDISALLTYDKPKDNMGIPQFKLNPSDGKQNVLPNIESSNELKNIIYQSIKDILNSPDCNKSNKLEKMTGFEKNKKMFSGRMNLSSSTKEGIFLIIVGILFLLLLDMLIRIGKSI